MNAEQIIRDIKEHINKSCPDGTPYNKLYIGIAKDASSRLFIDHAVNKETDVWIYRTTDSEAIAREVEKYFLSRGMDGGPGGGDSATKQVYCFLQNAHTKR